VIDLACRSVGGAVVAANDEFFAAKENLIAATAPTFRPNTFTHRGQEYDGWETRRRRDEGHDWVMVRLGLPGVIREVVVDTAFFTGNFPSSCTVEATTVDGYPAPSELTGWTPLVPRSELRGDTQHRFEVSSSRRFTHVRLCIHPDGGVARLRVHGEPVADPRFLDGLPFDLANGATVTGCSNAFYSNAANLLAPGDAQSMGAGWETVRRRGSGNDWVEIRLAAAGTVRVAELDTTHFKGNAPGWAAVHGRLGGDWFLLLPRTRLQPDTRHRFLIDAPPADEARLDIYPDGGMARLRLFGVPTPDGRAVLHGRWRETA
jgi:allantoicase